MTGKFAAERHLLPCVHKANSTYVLFDTQFFSEETCFGREWPFVKRIYIFIFYQNMDGLYMEKSYIFAGFENRTRRMEGSMLY